MASDNAALPGAALSAPAADDPARTTELQKRREGVLAQKSTLTSRISETTRTIAFGVLGSCYALLIADETITALFAPVRALLLASAMLALCAIVADAAQYLFGYINVQKALVHEEQQYPKDWSYRARRICFLLKQAFAYGAALLLILAICIVLL